MKHHLTAATSAVKVIQDAVMPNISEMVESKIVELEAKGSDEAFFICDVGDIVNKVSKWRELLPRVAPFYAVKCNTDETVVKTLVDLGLGFDCASKGEIAQILRHDVSPSRIIYANPCKQRSFVKYAAKHGVDLMTFDNEAELVKIKDLFPSARLVLRILPTTQVQVQCELGNKFGCHPDNVLQLLLKAQELDLNVVGISFHVGSGVEEAKAFYHAVRQARDAWELATELGFDMTLLDVGGGFPGQKSAPVTFEEIADVLNAALDLYFPEESEVEVIAEPGRYFVASAFSLTCNIIAKRSVARDVADGNAFEVGSPDGYHKQVLTKNDEPSFMYYLNDGLYGSFNSLMYDHAKVDPCVLNDSPCLFTSSVWGPTCDGLDCIMKECRLPEMEVGQWMFFPDMGAYTMCAGSTFNGMPRPACFYVCTAKLWRELRPEEEPVQEKRHCGEFPALMQAGQNAGTFGPINCCADEELVLA
ncbi:ornithine decarboxylase [Plakobranchus ocellatus]|uniref:ornithine decarboxylase n=1 Tax=Plakobranchus ocellatus TaxID=259542 RepID=A0AAV3YH64_9GAST|nr:ornithine decarboxylase [Plakobranchus ocellatus]